MVTKKGTRTATPGPRYCGYQWPDYNITWSVIPDGTWAIGYQANTFAFYDSTYPREMWMNEIRRAFNAWQANCGVIFHERTTPEALDPSTNPPIGYQINCPGQPQGDPRFGDIRIFACKGVYGLDHTYSPDPLTTISGDIGLNGYTPCGIQGQPPGYGGDLYSLMLHCIGGSLGLLECDMPSVMSSGGPWPELANQQLFLWDIEGGQHMYGPPRQIPPVIPPPKPPGPPFQPPPSAPTFTNSVFLNPAGEYNMSARIQDAYMKMLERMPASGEIPQWQSWATPNILDTFALSAEFYGDCLDLSAWIIKVYEHGLNRTPSPAEVESWVKALGG
jgi:hypothetical protein